MSIASAASLPSQLTGPAEYDAENISSIGGYAHTDQISIAMGGGTAKRNFSIDLQAPTGHPFAVRDYYGDDVFGVRGYASFSEGNAECNGVAFGIADIASSGTSVTRLDVRFHTICGGGIYGELLLGEPNPSSTVVTGARSPQWADIAVGTRSAAVLPLWVRNTGKTAVKVGTVVRSGADAAEFPIVGDQCSQKALPAHGSCSVTVAFAPSASRTRTASVTVPVGPKNVVTELSGTAPGGRTFLRINSQPGDDIGAGRSYLTTDAESTMRVSGGPDSFEAHIKNSTSDWFVLLTSDHALTLGTQAAGNSTDPKLLYFVVDGEGRGCGGSTGSVTIKQASFNSYGKPVAFDMTFIQKCTYDSTAPLTGEIAYRATNTPIAPTGPFILHVGQSLSAGHTISNSDENGGSYQLAVKTTGQAVLTSTSGPTAGQTLWTTPTSTRGSGHTLAVRPDGTLALLSSTGTVLWKTATAGSGTANFLSLDASGTLVLYTSTYRPVWSSRVLSPV